MHTEEEIQIHKEKENQMHTEEKPHSFNKTMKRVEQALDLHYRMKKHEKVLANPDSVETDVNHSTKRLAIYKEHLTRELIKLRDVDWPWLNDMCEAKFLEYIRYYNRKGVDTDFSDTKNDELKKEKKKAEKRFDIFKKLDVIPDWRPIFAQG